MRKPTKQLPATELRLSPAGPGHNAPSTIITVAPNALKLHPDDARHFTDRDIKRASRVLQVFGARVPLLVGDQGRVIGGQLLLLAAQAIGLPEIPVIYATDLDLLHERMLSAALSKVGELGRWKKDKQRALLVEIIDTLPNFDLEGLALDMGEIDLILDGTEALDINERQPVPPGPAVARLGDMFQLGTHRIGCGDATDGAFVRELMNGVTAAAVFTDPPYGCSIAGFASTKKRREFVQGSGDMNEAELSFFFARICRTIEQSCRPGALVYMCMDWRGLATLIEAARPSLGAPINIAVWVKDRAGMGSFLRSRHEMIPIFSKPGGKRRNNVQLGAYGRDRSNVWEYPSAATIGRTSEEGNMLSIHATPKPVKMIADALLDATGRRDIVLDLFLGSGSTLVAADKVGRACYGIDLDPLYVDASIRRLQTWTGRPAIHLRSGRSFAEMEAIARSEMPDRA